MIPVLLDPWLLDFSANYEEMNLQTGALRCVFSDLKAHHPLDVLPFFSLDEQAEFWNRFANYRGADSRTIVQWINALSINRELDIEPASIEDLPCPDLSQTWLKLLAVTGNTDDPPTWRSPMILLPSARKNMWPQESEINFIHRDIQKSRNLVCIDSVKSHHFFERDIDPWRLKCIGEPRPADPLNTRTASCKRLPRPPQLPYNMPLTELIEALEAIHGWQCGTEDRLFYIPPATWDPTQECKQQWRNAEMFPAGVVHKRSRQTESGFLDINGYVWVWDLGEKNHWDVKTTIDVRIARVSYDGKKLPT